MKVILSSIFIFLSFLACQREAKDIYIVIPEESGKISLLASSELQAYLSEIYPEYTFLINQNNPGSKPSISIGTCEHLNLPGGIQDSVPENQEGFLINPVDDQSVVITSNGELGVLYGVYHLLEKLGCRFMLDTEYIPERTGSPVFKEWNLKDEPLVSDRYANPWEVYLEGCSSWDLAKWKQYISNTQKMGYNSLLIHAYGNDPMFSFSFKGKTKPVGHLTSSIKGRGWGQKHVNDVRRMPGGEKVFPSYAFGSERAIVPDEEREVRSQEFMGEVFHFAKQRGVRVNFALDFDTLSNIPQEMVLTLPEPDRFQVSFDGIDWMGEKGGTYWIPRPDTPQGYQYYKAQVKQVLKLYPEISTYTLWRRRQKSIFCEIQYEELPAPWKKEYKLFISEHPGSGDLPQAASTFAHRKLALTYRKIFDELGRDDVKLATGSWHLYNDLKLYETLEVFIPKDMKIIILDSEITRSEINLQNPEWIRQLSAILSQDRYVPIIWAHHDDGEYVGSPFPEFREFHDLLLDLKADGFGVIHWINRPLDIFFINHMRQVWLNTRNETALATCKYLADGIWFNDNQASDKIGGYLYDFWQDFPPMSRANSAYVFDKRIDEYGDPDTILQKIDQRTAYLKSIDSSKFSKRQKELYAYYLNYESFLKMFIENQLKYEEMQELIEHEKWEDAERIARTATPRECMEQLARTATESFVTNGDMGLLFSLGVRWLPHFTNLKQSLGMEPVHINFQPTLHEALAQMPGKESFFIDLNGTYWKAMGETETGLVILEPGLNTRKSGSGISRMEEIFSYGVLIDSPLQIPVETIGTSERLAPGTYTLELLFSTLGSEAELLVEICDSVHQMKITPFSLESVDVLNQDWSVPVISIKPMAGKAVLCGISLKPIKPFYHDYTD